MAKIQIKSETRKDLSFSEEYDRCVTDKEYTRGIINCAIEKGGWKFHTNLQKTFLDESDMDVEGFWNKIASYNFIQEPERHT